MPPDDRYTTCGSDSSPALALDPEAELSPGLSGPGGTGDGGRGHSDTSGVLAAGPSRFIDPLDPDLRNMTEC